METEYNLEVNGFDFVVKVTDDTYADPPWNQGDGHGSVRKCGNPHWHGEGQSTKKPGERPMNKPDRNTYQYYYDWKGACKQARTEGWGPGGVHEAVQADFDFLKGYVQGTWEYVLVTVTLANRPDYDSCVGDVETFKDYQWEFAKELAQEVLDSYLDDMEENKLKGMKNGIR